MSLVQNRRRLRQPRRQEINDSLSDSTEGDVQVDEQFEVEMALYDQRFAKGVLAARWLEAHIASEQMEGVVLSGTSTSTSSTTVLSATQPAISNRTTSSGR